VKKLKDEGMEMNREECYDVHVCLDATFLLVFALLDNAASIYL